MQARKAKRLQAITGRSSTRRRALAHGKRPHLAWKIERGAGVPEKLAILAGFDTQERGQSGRMYLTRNQAQWQHCRGFESRPLRQYTGNPAINTVAGFFLFRVM